MTQTRNQLETMAKQDISVTPDTQKAAVLALLARDPDTGYEPNEIAAKTPIPVDNVYPVLKRLREQDLVEKLSDHYLVANEYADEVQDLVLTTRQSAVAADISSRNTAPETVEAPSPSDLDAPAGEVDSDPR